MYIRTPYSSGPGLGVSPPIPKPKEELSKPILPAPTPTLAERIRASLANRILRNPNIRLAVTHSETPLDNATALRNIEDAIQYDTASRSSYKSAPGGRVPLNIRMLWAILQLAKMYNIQISELAGGVHSRGSLHYHGRAVDINVINGRRVGRTHPDVAKFKRDCRKLGASSVLGPGDPDHATHIHCAWTPP